MEQGVTHSSGESQVSMLSPPPYCLHTHACSVASKRWQLGIQRTISVSLNAKKTKEIIAAFRRHTYRRNKLSPSCCINRAKTISRTASILVLSSLPCCPLGITGVSKKGPKNSTNIFSRAVTTFYTHMHRMTIH